MLTDTPGRAHHIEETMSGATAIDPIGILAVLLLSPLTGSS